MPDDSGIVLSSFGKRLGKNIARLLHSVRKLAKSQDEFCKRLGVFVSFVYDEMIRLGETHDSAADIVVEFNNVLMEKMEQRLGISKEGDKLKGSTNANQ